MKSLRETNLTALGKLSASNPVVYPVSAYLDYADYKNEPVTKKLIAEVDELYYARFNTEAEFFDAVRTDFGYWQYKTLEEAYNDYLKIDNRYYKKG